MWLKLETGMLLMLLLFSVLWKRKQDFSIGKLFGISSLWNSPRLSFFLWPIRSLAPYSSQMQTFMHANMHRQAHSHDHTTFIELWASAAERESGHFNQPNNPLQYFNLLPPFNASCPPPPHETYKYRPYQNNPLSLLVPLWQPYDYFLHVMTAAVTFFKPFIHKHTCKTAFHYQNSKPVKVPSSPCLNCKSKLFQVESSNRDRLDTLDKGWLIECSKTAKHGHQCMEDWVLTWIGFFFFFFL